MDELLIIEDDVSMSTRLVSIFKRKGFAVKAAKDLSKGYQAFVQKRPNCILLDLHLPDGHSLEDFYTKILSLQEKEGENPCPIVVLTASDAQEDLKALLGAGLYTIHSKSDPIDSVEDSIRQEIAISKRNNLQIVEGGGDIGSSLKSLWNKGDAVKLCL